MTYFNYLPKFNYTFPDGTTKPVVNLYKRGYVRQSKNKKAFDTILMKGGQKPEQLANNLYENPMLFWQILYANNVISREDWSLTDIELNDLLRNYYTGKSFHIFGIPELTLRRGDIITTAVDGLQADPDNWAIVDNYDEKIRKIDCINFTSGFFDSLEGTEIFIWRLKNSVVDNDDSDQMIQIFSSSNDDPTFIAKKVTSIQQSLNEFKNSSDSKVISPFRETEGTTLKDTLTIGFDSNTTTLIAKYINGNALPSDITIFSLKEFLEDIETTKRAVFVPKKTLTGDITESLGIVLSSSNALSSYSRVSSLN